MTGEIHPEEDQGRGDDHSLARHYSDRWKMSPEELIIDSLNEMIRVISRLEKENSALREQLRLANTDAFNLEAELNDVKDDLYEERRYNSLCVCPCDCR